jgi:hypothetical protein
MAKDQDPIGGKQTIIFPIRELLNTTKKNILSFYFVYYWFVHTLCRYHQDNARLFVLIVVAKKFFLNGVSVGVIYDSTVFLLGPMENPQSQDHVIF